MPKSFNESIFNGFVMVVLGTAVLGFVTSIAALPGATVLVVILGGSVSIVLAGVMIIQHFLKNRG